jgi:ppGpp synthetase/RelA/SpoT-type nucleotidyltranferase
MPDSKEFDMSRNYTINYKREKHVAMKTTGYRKLHVTVMLCITSEGNKLPPNNII